MNSHGDDIETATARTTESSPLLVAKAVLVKDRPVVVATAVTSTTPPPPGVADGGVWGSIIHHGNSTCGWGFLCCLFCGCMPAFIVCCNPFDKKRVYKYNGNLYDASGTFVGEASQSEFEEGEIYTNNVDSNKQQEILTIAFVVGLLFSGYVYIKNISDGSY